MQPYTVVIKRNYELREMLETDEEIDVYVASVEAETPRQAAREGVKQAFVADRENTQAKEYFDRKVSIDNYDVIVVFEGLPTVALYWFQL